MRIENKKTWNKDDMDFRTRMSTSRVKDVKRFIEEYESDLKKEERLEKQVCRFCTYKKGELSMSAFTDTNCSKCQIDMLFPSSSIDKLCERCARMLEACKHCGGHMD